MSTGWRVERSLVATALGAAPGLAWLAAAGPAQAAVVALLGGCIGLGLSAPGVSAGRVARGVTSALFPWAVEAVPPESPRRVYTPEDFPCPEPMPGRDGCAWIDSSGETAFAVVVPAANATARELQAIGLRLRAWQAENPFVRRILGLERLLEGRASETPADFLGLAVPPWTAKVALAIVDPSAVGAQAGRDLIRTLDGTSVAMVVSPEFSMHVQR
ncbi:MAG TPA: hypothetical protein VF590_26470 [Isosphaeraceae bacterium]